MASPDNGGGSASLYFALAAVTLLVIVAAQYASHRVLFKRCLGIGSTTFLILFVMSTFPLLNPFTYYPLLLAYYPLLILCGFMVLTGSCDACEHPVSLEKQSA